MPSTKLEGAVARMNAERIKRIDESLVRMKHIRYVLENLTVSHSIKDKARIRQARRDCTTETVRLNRLKKVKY